MNTMENDLHAAQMAQWKATTAKTDAETEQVKVATEKIRLEIEIMKKNIA